MNKNIIIDLEAKIRQISDKPKSYKALTPDEKILIPGLRSVFQEEIKELLKKDFKTHLPALKMHRSRDISHLKDLKVNKKLPPFISFPTDMDELKALMETRTISYSNSHPTLTKKNDIDNLLSLSPKAPNNNNILECLDQGMPSGRKEVLNLLKWFLTMKQKYENTEEFDIVVLMCRQELLKQVKVECKHRGTLLKMIFSYYQNSFARKKIELETEQEKLRNYYEAYIASIIDSNKTQTDTQFSKIQELENAINKNQLALKNFEEDIEFYKKKLHETQRMYLAEQEIWKKRAKDLMKENNRKPMVVSADFHKLAIAKWRKDLFHSEIEKQPNLELPDSIRHKLENEEPLTEEELAIYRSVYYQKEEEEVHLKNFKESETQTEPPPELLERKIIKDDEDYWEKVIGNLSKADPQVIKSIKPAVFVIKYPKETQTEKLFEENIFKNLDDLLEESQEYLNNIKDSKNIEYSNLSYVSSYSPDTDKPGDINKKGVLDYLTNPAKNKKKVQDIGFIEDFNDFDYKVNESLPSYFQPISTKDPNSKMNESLPYDFKNQPQNIRKSKSNMDENLLVDPNFPINNLETEENESEADEYNNIEDEEYKKYIQNQPDYKKPKQPEDFVDENNPKKTSKKKFKGPDSEGFDGIDGTDEIGEISRIGKIGETGEIGEIKPVKKLKHKDINSTSGETNKKNENSKDSSHRNKNKSPDNEVISDDSSDSDYTQSEISQELIKNNKRSSVDDLNIRSQNFKKSKQFGKERFSVMTSSKMHEIQELNENIEEEKSDLITNDKNVYKYVIQVEDDNSVKKFTSNYKIKKDTDPKDPNLDRRKSALIPKRRQSEVVQDIIKGKLGDGLKKITGNIIKSIQDRKNELEELERLIELKRQELEKMDPLADPQEGYKSGKDIRGRRASDVGAFSKSLLGLKGPKSSKISENSLLRDDENPSERQKKRSVNKLDESFDPDVIDEEDESLDEFMPPSDCSQESWVQGLKVGYYHGKKKGFVQGKLFNKEESEMEGYLQAIQEMTKDPSMLEDINYLKSTNRNSESPTQATFKSKKLKQTDLKSVKEPTKFSEFNFNKQKFISKKNNNAISDSINQLLKKLPEYIKKQSKLSRRMVYKMISGFYESAYSTIGNEDFSDLITVCYEDICKKYGLKKVSDRKFLEFISSVIKNNGFRKCLVFMKLMSIGNWISTINYSKHTLQMYLESYYFVINSKIGIVMNYDETDDKSFIPINRALECIKEKLEGRMEKTRISYLASFLEHKSVPDPKKINTGIVELELVLETMCDTYETVQQTVRTWVEKIFGVLHPDSQSPVPLYTFMIAMKTVNFNKTNKLDEMQFKDKLSLDDIYEICINVNAFHESDLNNLIKSYPGNLDTSYNELLGIVSKLGAIEKAFESYSPDEWEKRLEDCIGLTRDNNDAGVLVWQIYENELKRISKDHFN